MSFMSRLALPVLRAPRSQPSVPAIRPVLRAEAPSPAPLPAVPAGKPMRLWVPQGGTREVVILDVGPGPILDEHTWRNPETGRWDMHQRCCAERDTCPLCNQEETFGPFRRDMYLMAADLGWRARDNRKLLVLRDQRIHDMLAAAGGEDGWRGLTLRLERGEKQRAPLGTGTLLGRSGTRDLPGAFDCETLMPLLDGAALRKLYGGSSPPGSREESEAAFAAAEMEAA